jgi:hypothetical protein
MKCLISTSGTSRSVISGGEQEGVRDETWQFDVNGGFARPFRLFDGVKKRDVRWNLWSSFTNYHP